MNPTSNGMGSDSSVVSHGVYICYYLRSRYCLVVELIFCIRGVCLDRQFIGSRQSLVTIFFFIGSFDSPSVIFFVAGLLLFEYWEHGQLLLIFEKRHSFILLLSGSLQILDLRFTSKLRF